MSTMFNQICINEEMLTNIYIYIYIYIYYFSIGLFNASLVVDFARIVLHYSAPKVVNDNWKSPL